jgi:hypothetical protein
MSREIYVRMNFDRDAGKKPKNRESSAKIETVGNPVYMVSLTCVVPQ